MCVNPSAQILPKILIIKNKKFIILNSNILQS